MSELRRRILRPVSTKESKPDHSDESSSRNKPLSLSPSEVIPLLFLFILFLLSLSIYLNDKLPEVSSRKGNSSDFSSANALKYLHDLVDFGPRVTGSYENEVQAVNYITTIISDIMKKTSSQHSIKYDLQKVSGEFSLSFLSKQVNLIYRNIQNVIVRLGPKIQSDKSLLLNCHFDSVPLSPGASDDGLNCAIMLEVLRVIATSNETLLHNIIFLFNGAEENPLMGSHGFITQHEWAKEVKAFINLESCGAGGREVLFQAGPNHPWLIKNYGKAAKHPSGFVVAEEIFQSGLVPSDTDFRIFRDYGGIPGLDFAHCKNGFVYHTKLDNIQSISNVLGVIQHTGDNILSLVKTILKSNEFESPEKYKNGKQVYYDLFGLLFINYSVDFGKALNSVAVILAIAGYYMTAYYTHSWTILRNFCPLSSTIMYGTIVLSLIYNLSLAYFLDAFGLSMSWYSNSFFIVPLYIIPTIIIMLINILQYERYEKSKTHTNMKLKSQCLSVLLFWTTILFLSTFFNLRSAFLLMMLVLIPAVYTLILSFVKTASNRLLWTILFLICTIPASLYITYLGVSAFRLFIPITGRFGSEKNPEFIISILATLLSAAVFSYVSCLILAVKKQWVVINILMVIHFVSILGVAFLPSFFPFSIETPQRVLATHVNRQFFDLGKSFKRSDSLFWIQNMDRRGRSVLELLDNAPSIDIFCDKDKFCGLPWFSKFQERSASSCLSSAPHTITDETYLELLEKKFVSKNIIHYHFNITGPDHMGLILSPRHNCTLKSWSLPGKIQAQPSYMVGYVHGLHNSDWSVHFDIQVPESYDFDSYVVIQVYGLYFHHKKYFSKAFSDLILQFPPWSHVSPCLATYKSFIF